MKRDPVESYCMSCDIGCKMCDLDGTCLLPGKNYYFENGTLTNSCSIEGSKPSGVHCFICSVENCVTCLSDNVCSYCNEGFFLNDDGVCECDSLIATTTEENDCKFFFSFSTYFFFIILLIKLITIKNPSPLSPKKLISYSIKDLNLHIYFR